MSAAEHIISPWVMRVTSGCLNLRQLVPIMAALHCNLP